jgi:hypothetical protein
MLHAKAMAIVVAFDIYKELAEGSVNRDWKVNKPVDFFTFRETLARQMLSYNPKKCKYDERFRVFTQSTKAKRSPTPPLVGNTTTTDAGISETTLALHTSKKKRLCGFIANLKDHYEACTMEEKGKKLNCVFCGIPAYQYCAICEVALHKFPRDGNGVSCFFHWHDSGCFGLARDDWRLTNKKMKDWSYPTMVEMKSNDEQMKRLSELVTNRVGNFNGNNDDFVGNSESESDD